MVKISLVCSHGGHLTEMQQILPSFGNEEIFWVTGHSDREVPGKVYYVENIGTSPTRMLLAFIRILSIFLKERPSVVVSTGAEIAIPAVLLARAMGAKTIFIESLCRVSSLSISGFLLLPLVDLFLVQWPGLVRLTHGKGRFWGQVI